MIKDFFTLSYDDKQLKVLQVKRGETVCFGQLNLQPGIVSNSKVLRKENFAEHLRVLLSKTKPQKIESEYVVAVIPESKVFIKMLEIPKIDLDKIEQAITWQAETLLPVAPENLYLDWQKIAETSEGKIKILITACPRDIIDSLVESLQIIKLTPISIKSKAGALAGLFSRTPHVSVFIINIEEDETGLIIAKNNVSRVSTSIPTTEDKKALLDKVRETIDFYEQRKGERKIQGIIIVSQEKSDELKKIIETKTKLPTKIGKYPDKKAKISSKDEPAYLINMGLAYNPFSGVNLLPDSLKKNILIQEMNKKFSLIEKFILLIAGLLVLALGLTWWILLLGDNKTDKILSSVRLAQISPKAQEIETKIIDLNQRLDRIVKLKGNKSNYSKILETIGEIPQEGVKILSFERDEETTKFELTGIAEERSQLLSYRQKLQNEETIQNTTLSLKSLERPQNINFELYFDVKN